MNNVFSNIERYGEKEKQVEIWMVYEPHRVGIAIKNSMALSGQYVDGTGIGLKNISLMMEQMGGTAEMDMTEGNYQIILYFPLQSEE